MYVHQREKSLFSNTYTKIIRNPFKTVLHFVGGQGHFENLITAISPLWQQFPSLHVGRSWGTDLLGVKG